MASFRNLSFFIWACVFLTLVVVTVRVDGASIWGKIAILFTVPERLSPKEECDVLACPGPVAHYKSLGCASRYAYSRCCPSHYICDHLNQKPKHKCHVNNQEYEIGERIREKDANLCEKDCICANTTSGFADFECTSQEELCSRHVPSNTSCFMRYNLDGCCTNPTEVCLNRPSMRRTCRDEDKSIYLDGEYFVCNKYSSSICICNGDIEDQESRITCHRYTDRWAFSDIHAVSGYLQKCAPVYLEKDNKIGIHRQFWRCQTHKDYLLPEYLPGEVEYPRWSACYFGNLTMHINDRINSLLYGYDSCILCSCEIPPVPTCVIKSNRFC